MQKNSINTKEIARFGLLAAMALVLGYVDRMIPIAPGIPGIKLGLANTVLLYAVYLMGPRSAALLMLVKVGLNGLLFAGPVAMLYSLAGGVLSLMAMLCLSRIRGMGALGVSIAGAVAHNLGQLAVACLMVTPQAALWYLPVLMISALGTGALTGLVARGAMAALEGIKRQGNG